MEDCLRRAPHPLGGPLAELGKWTQEAAGKLLRSLPQPPARPTASAPSAIGPEKGGAKSESRPLELSKLNPSLYVVGLETVERLMPRYLAKSGIACERMQHAGLPVDAIRKVLEALFTIPSGESEQCEEALREVFALVDASGDGLLDQDEFLAVLPLMGEDVPPSVVGKLFAAGDLDSNGTISGAEFVSFMRVANPMDAATADGWRAFLPESIANYEEMVLLQVAKRKIIGKASAWRSVPQDELEMVQRSADAPYSSTLLLSKDDLANAEALIDGLRALGFRDDEVRVVAKALFVTNDDEDYAAVFQIFDRDATGGIDPFEFRAIMALLGEHATEAEARELFLEADTDNDGILDVAEFVQLLRRISPKSTAAEDARELRTALARDRLQARIAQSSIGNVDPAAADAMVQVLLLGATKCGKTFLLNQVLAQKLPKGGTVAVGVGALTVRIGGHAVALQILDTPGDPRFAPLGHIFYSSTPYALLVFDATSFESFTALTPLYDAFIAKHPGLDPAAHICLVSNTARLGVKRAVSAGYATSWCRQRGGIPFFEVGAESPQGILEPLHHIADEYFTTNPIGSEANAAGVPAAACAPSRTATGPSLVAAPLGGGEAGGLQRQHTKGKVGFVS